MPFPNFVVDFDSTFVTVESLDVLAGIALTERSGHDALTAEVRGLTARAMNGEIPFGEALARRLALIAPRREHLERLVERLHASVSPSFLHHRKFLSNHADDIWIVSAGFHAYIEPVVTRFGLRAERILANRFSFEGDAIVGFDATNPLAGEGGKPRAVAALSLARPIVAIGDGMSDFELYATGVADRFFAWTESVCRERVVAVAPEAAHTLDDIFTALRLAVPEIS